MSRIPVHTLEGAPENTGAGEVGDVSDVTRKCALAAGWSEHELVEAFAQLAANLSADDFNHYARTELDVPTASAGSR